VDIIEILDLE